MSKPLMTAGETFVPKTEEEIAAAIEKRKMADERERQANEAARAVQNGDATPTPEELKKHERVAQASHTQLTAMWEYAAATGTLTHYVNAVLLAAAIIVANAKTHGEQVRIIEYITKTAAGMNESNRKQSPNNSEH
jgi:hypothetical protein